MFTRRQFISAISVMATTPIPGFSMVASKSFGIAWTSFPIRIRQAREAQAKQEKSGTPPPPFPAEKFIDACHSFLADGCQMEIEQLTSTEANYLKRIRTQLESHGMFLELAVNAKALESAEAIAKIASTAKQLGVSILRIACLSGRRYEDFREMAKWKEFAAHWQQTLEKAEPALKKHALYAAIENHKDWLADEQVAILKKISSPHIGACVDFGNNLSLLEDAFEVAEKLAPYAITTHLKDLAVKPYQDGFELSEVPLGEGILPLAKIIARLREHRPNIHLCLEMLTRDPLKVPYKTDLYWATQGRRDETLIKKFEATTLKEASSTPLPRVNHLDDVRALQAENDNLQACADYAKQRLKL